MGIIGVLEGTTMLLVSVLFVIVLLELLQLVYYFDLVSGFLSQEGRDKFVSDPEGGGRSNDVEVSKPLTVKILERCCHFHS